MSIAKRLIDLARSNLNTLLERAAETVDPRRKLASITDEELEAELKRRRAARENEARLGAAKAKVEGEYDKDREGREKMARERDERVRAARTARESADRAAREAEARRRAARAGARPSSGSGSTGAGAGARPGASGGRQNVPRGGNPELAQYYARLELPYGADFAAVKASFRRLMRKYHPDLHVNDPVKHKTATQLSMSLTTAYNELERHLTGRR